MARTLAEIKGFANAVPDEKRENRVISVVRVVCVPLTIINYHLTNNIYYEDYSKLSPLGRDVGLLLCNYRMCQGW